MMRPEDLKPAPEYIPVTNFTDEQAKSVFRQKVESIVKGLLSPIRIGGGFTIPLFEMRGGKDITEVYYSLDDHKLRRGRLEIGRGQEVLLGVMGEYGLDQSVSYKSGEDKQRSAWNVERLVFPSQIIPGLVFERERQYSRETGDTFFVSWSVTDRGPFMRFNPVPLVKKSA